MTEQAAKPKMKYKSFTYRTSLKRVAERAGILKSGDKPELRVASPPESKARPASGPRRICSSVPWKPAR